MRYFGSLGTFIVLMSSLLLQTKAWSSEIESKQLVPGQQNGVEAIVTKVEQESLTLKPTYSESAEISIPRQDDGTLSVGDKVVLEEQRLRKIGESSPDSMLPDVKERKEAGMPQSSP
jgi:hypothetical protein